MEEDSASKTTFIGGAPLTFLENLQSSSIIPARSTAPNTYWSVRINQSLYNNRTSVVYSLSLVLGHVLSPVRSLPRHSLLLIANYTSEPVC